MDEERLGCVGSVNDGLVIFDINGLDNIDEDGLFDGLEDIAGGWDIDKDALRDWLVNLFLASGCDINEDGLSDWLVDLFLASGCDINEDGLSDWLVNLFLASGGDINENSSADWLVNLSIASGGDIDDDSFLNWSGLGDVTEFVDVDDVVSGGGDFIDGNFRVDDSNGLLVGLEDIKFGVSISVNNVVSGNILGSIDGLGGVRGAVNFLWSVFDVGNKPVLLSLFNLIIIDSVSSGGGVVFWLLSLLDISDGLDS